MKLIDILVEELPKRGGWAEGVVAITQDSDKAINNYKTADGLETNEHGTWRYSSAWEGYSLPASDSLCLASDYTTAIIIREQYEAALAAKNDGWIEWGGGECPVNHSEMVDVIFGHGGRMSTNIAGCWRWNHGGTDSDIIAYRLHKPQEAEQAKADEEADLNECIGQDAAPVWSGEGQPPVGVECEYSWAGEPWASGVIRYISKHTIIIETQADSTGDTECAYHPTDIKLRPLRTEADRKRDEAIEEMIKIATMYTTKSIGLDLAFNSIYNSIAAGEIPGVKLED
ncbi:TPA: hypothetical protein MDE43_004757 [Klebsiella pneumoniae]|nr:hypothetical protein [Klebsiella pneumoniae]